MNLLHLRSLTRVFCDPGVADSGRGLLIADNHGVVPDDVTPGEHILGVMTTGHHSRNVQNEPENKL